MSGQQLDTPTLSPLLMTCNGQDDPDLKIQALHRVTKQHLESRTKLMQLMQRGKHPLLEGICVE